MTPPQMPTFHRPWPASSPGILCPPGNDTYKVGCSSPSRCPWALLRQNFSGQELSSLVSPVFLVHFSGSGEGEAIFLPALASLRDSSSDLGCEGFRLWLSVPGLQ